jgi:hypothetical protein
MFGSTATHEGFHWNPTYNNRGGSSLTAESPYYGNNFCISAAFDKYCTLYDTEVEHLKSLINNLEE